jgi:signal transduction histidine kinase
LSFIVKITTRIISGYGLLIAVLMGLVVYQVVTINRMQSINRTLSDINFQNARACLQASRDLDLVEEYAWKSFALADPDYLRKLRESQKNYETSLMQIKHYANSGEEMGEVKRLKQLWNAFTSDLESWEQDLPKSGTDLPESLQDDLEQLKVQTESVYQSSLRSMKSKVENSRKTGDTAALVLWCVTFLALAISILVSFLIFRSISKPLSNLTEGTRAIAEGKFFYRLDASRKDEFSQLARDFNTMTQKLKELDELKKGFVTHVSHELKAPLASMKETIQLLLEEIPGPLTEKQKRLLTLNLQSGMRLTSMITNLLDISKTEAGAMEYELKNQDLIPLVRNAVAELEVQAQEKQIQIKASLPEIPLPVECDRDRIVQVMVNLVGNAVKFSPKKASVEVSVEATRDIPQNLPKRWQQLIANADRDGSFGLVSVADSGPGIPDVDKEKIFERFHQVKQGKKLAGQGAGLGLAICRIIVQAHRGAIWVEDNPGGGSCFRMLLRPGGDEEGGIPRASRPI